MKLKSILYLALAGTLMGGTISCTKLNEEFNSELEEGDASNVDAA